jgi:surfeit locus 1 family protein
VSRPAAPVASGTRAPPRRRPVARIVLLAGLALAFVGFTALGYWQMERRAWKHDLIERVDARVHAPPVAPPGPDQWSTISAARDEYRRVTVSGRYLDGADSRVQAVTSIGAGFWLISPLRLDDGSLVLVNRGFVAPDWSPPPPRAAAESADIRITGLLRLSEPGGGFLRRNAPAQGRWYSRDVPAIAAAHGLRQVAPYFIDADADSAGGSASAGGREGPVGGLTVIGFRDHHLQYALTWFALALMVVLAAWRVWHEDRRRPPTPRRSADAGQADDSRD